MNATINTESSIRKVAVIGAGVMGAGITAHLANAGIAVLLLDIVPPNASERNVMAQTALAKLQQADPAPFMHPKNARLIMLGNIEDDLAKLHDCDWIIEAVVENLAIKQSLYHKLSTVRRDDAVVSSNTSSIPLHTLLEGLPDDFAAHFLITHFFNPPRYMRLLEIVSAAQTAPDAVAKIHYCADVQLGKGVVQCHDTAGFIANRIGIFWVQTAILEAIALGLSVEQADAVLSKPFGIPKTGVFGLSDLVGLDLMPHLLQSMRHLLPASDPLMAKMQLPDVVQNLIANGYTGRKGKGGFYRLVTQDGGKVKQSINLQTGEYAASQPAQLDSLAAAKHGGVSALLNHADVGGQYAWRVWSQTLCYAASLVPEIADDITAVDQAMRLGYNWQYGVFELLDRIGAEAFVTRLHTENVAVPPLLATAHGFYHHANGTSAYLGTDGAYHALQRPAGVLLLADIKQHSQALAANASASLWDIGDGVVCLEFTSFNNTLDPLVLDMIQHAIPLIQQHYRALVIYNEGENFSLGANLGLLLQTVSTGAWEQLEGVVRYGQHTYQALRYAPFPVIGAPSGMALGGGCEILLHCDAVQAHAETYMGLVETGVGIIPSWGGCKTMLQRWLANPQRPQGAMPAISRCFELLSMATVSKSAALAKDYLYLRPDDGITMNRARLLADAKARALAMAENYQPPQPQSLALPGETARIALELAIHDFHAQGKATAHDVVVASALARVLSGGATDITDSLSEDDLLRLEREQFMQLVHEPATLARVQHLLQSGKPLRN